MAEKKVQTRQVKQKRDLSPAEKALIDQEKRARALFNKPESQELLDYIVTQFEGFALWHTKLGKDRKAPLASNKEGEQFRYLDRDEQVAETQRGAGIESCITFIKNKRK